MFTTDYTTSPKGIIKIENQDFSEVIKSAEKSKGFKTGKNCETITIGYNYETAINNITKKLETNNYERIFIIGLENNSIEEKVYFEKLIKLAPKNILFISFSYKSEKENFIHINTCFDNYSWLKIFDFINKSKLKTTIFIPKCDRNTISQIIYLSNKENNKIYIGKCAPILLNPSLMITLQKTFNIKEITTSKKDLEEILKDK